jgi:hypothetical protein
MALRIIDDQKKYPNYKMFVNVKNRETLEISVYA